MPSRFTGHRELAFGVLCLVLAIIAGITSSWIPAAILVIVGAVFVRRGLTKPK
jgi:hypothetical protein